MSSYEDGSESFFEFTINKGLVLNEEAQLGVIRLSRRHRLRFLTTGLIEVYATPSGANHVIMQTPRLRDLPIRLIDRLLRKGED